MKKLIIHVGAPKCGSSALQSILEVNEKNGNLNKVGFTYPLEFSRGLGQGNADPVFQEFLPQTVNDLTLSSNFLLKENKNIIISDEKLFGIVNKHKLIKLSISLKHEFEDMVIITAIREPSNWLLSDYSQHIKQNIHNISFPDHVVCREVHCNWFSYFLKLVENDGYFRLVACDYKNLFGCVSELLGVNKTFLSVTNEEVNVNFSLTPAQLEARRICSILGINDREKIETLEFVYQDFNLKEDNKSLLSYIRKKNEGYVEKIKSLKDVFFYE